MGCQQCKAYSEAAAGEITSAIVIYAKNLGDTLRETNVSLNQITVNAEVFENNEDGTEITTAKNDIRRVEVERIKERAGEISNSFKRRGSVAENKFSCNLNQLHNSILRQIEHCSLTNK